MSNPLLCMSEHRDIET